MSFITRTTCLPLLPLSADQICRFARLANKALAAIGSLKALGRNAFLVPAVTDIGELL
jgi:hypothetical protein